MEVRTRIAPSPTGDPHVGTLYIALFNLIFAKHHGGKFILRIEDTDQKRSHPQYEQNIFDALHWGKVTWDEGPDIGGPYGPYRQSERTEIYKEYVQQLIDAGKAYKCFATSEELSQMREIQEKTGQKVGYDRRYRNLSPFEVAERENRGEKYVVRLKVPLTGECEFVDKVKGKIVVPYAEVDDQVLLKSDGFPTYHLAVVVDDHLMKISHVIRGDEWITSTPKHILLYEAFGWEKPEFMHMPLLLGKDGRKLSKRKNPTSVFYYRDSGYLPEALTNFLTLMGYSMPHDQEFYSIDEISQKFDDTRIGQSGAFFDIQKLDWINQKYLIETLNEETLLESLLNWNFSKDHLRKLIPLVHTRMKTFGEFMELCDFFFINTIPHSKELLCPKGLTEEDSAYLLQGWLMLLEEKVQWTQEVVEETSHTLAKLFNVNHKKVIMPIFFATLMGKRFGPPLYASAELLGRDRIRARILQAIEFLGGLSSKKVDLLKKCLQKEDCSSIIAAEKQKGS